MVIAGKVVIISLIATRCDHRHHPHPGHTNHPLCKRFGPKHIHCAKNKKKIDLKIEYKLKAVEATMMALGDR